MGYNYYVACKSCQKFVDLGRWRIFHNLQFPHELNNIFLGAGNVAAALISGESLRERLRVLDDPYSVNYNKEPDFQKLAGILAGFCNEHQTHELYFINSSGDFPWMACDQYPWYEWQEVIGPNTNIQNVDLPKNLIHDLQLKSWGEIEKHLLKSRRYDPVTFPGDINLVKHGFEKVSKG
ncbi:MAG TPA: hypothetical protein VMH87_13565 [Pseudomonadales bacterium]|nr:hypothetical protein [Pseudomonadales bacterium]